MFSIGKSESEDLCFSTHQSYYIESWVFGHLSCVLLGSWKHFNFNWFGLIRLNLGIVLTQATTTQYKHANAFPMWFEASWESLSTENVFFPIEHKKPNQPGVVDRNRTRPCYYLFFCALNSIQKKINVIRYQLVQTM